MLEGILALPEHERTATSLYYIDGYSQNEIAAFLEIPAKTDKSRLYSSRKRLKERMVDMVESTMKSAPLPGRFSESVVRLVASDEDLAGAREFLASGYHGKRDPGVFDSVASAHEARVYVVQDGSPHAFSWGTIPGEMCSRWARFRGIATTATRRTGRN